MPLYQLFCLARPQLPKAQLAESIRRIGQAVFAQQGLLVDLQHFGDRPLAKKVRQPGAAYNYVSLLSRPSLLYDHNWSLLLAYTSQSSCLKVNMYDLDMADCIPRRV